MTRQSLNRTISRVYMALALVLLVAFATKLAGYVPGLGAALGLSDDGIGLAARIYEFIKEMAPLLIAVLATYLASALQKRSKFTASLEQEWRALVATKNALYAFCEMAYPTADDYVATFCRMSETLDNMRIIYRNVGETDELIGIYPYVPLHDMRRALQTLDPRKNKNVTPEYRKLVRDAILHSFYALRENFLEELDLEEPVHPLLISGGRRLKVPGFSAPAQRLQERQRDRQNARDSEQRSSRREDIDGLLGELHAREQAGG